MASRRVGGALRWANPVLNVSEAHLQRVLDEYRDFIKDARPHRAIGSRTLATSETPALAARSINQPHSGSVELRIGVAMTVAQLAVVTDEPARIGVDAVTTYGLQLALALPVIRACDAWTLTADLPCSRERAPRTLRLEGQSRRGEPRRRRES